MPDTLPLPSSPILLLDLPAQHAPIRAELDEALRHALDEAAFIQGPAVQQFAQELSAYLGGPHVVPCANGTDALQLALMALRLPPGTEVIVPAFTYVATLEAAAVLGLVPVPADVRPDTFNLDPQAVEAAITSRTGAIVAVHLFGQCADLEALRTLADHHGVALIEDNAQAIGATFTTSGGATWVAGTVGEVGTTSFFPSKNLGGFGDGGALFTRDEARAAYLRQLANHGQTRKYHHEHIGLNSRLDTLQAALLRVKLRYLRQWTAARQHVAAQYDATLADVPGLAVPARDPRSTHVFHQYTLTVADEPGRRDALQQHLGAHGVPSQVYYPLPNHLQPAYHYLGYRAGQFPVAERLCRTVLSVPIHPTLTEEQVAYVAAAVRAGV
ncbi:DegT/DnrJ/EryC1/StrS family aminotransferase [Hymenobacter psychrotolerans]|uniref:dTDP-4-amino-4,6-dideoxygalactose transaminase n=1 Tax=Hymenobacter psychrotolerans DSM 18569 TaxID=1121959 RepID=A0A1M6V4D5_9BACT|nr:DegT/DnrJ/EryC1/StrS family aminotransferase [Hymenobacter psychrotolerans]SHK76235.1 dTDP-4-amino-4,6-dideoxygalactose transaminase [Hymenobacter psychrotolerans DSM 18569]